jgi:beta-lactamase regulating signal transducer with metallopeptidase domain/predicted  nucleic acid-binding Zn-ribbon protein
MIGALLLLKTSVLLAATLGAAYLLRRAPAAARHRLWTVAFAAMLALPLLAVALPALYVPMPSCCAAPTAPSIAPAPLSAALRDDTPAMPRGNGSRIVQDGSPVASTAGRFAPPPARTLLLTAWAAGSLAAGVVLLLSLVRVRRLAQAAHRLHDDAWTRSAADLGARLQLRRPARLFVSPAVGTPMAGGVWRPTIFLPAAARDWSAERRDVVLAHELAHLAGHDPLRHVAARLAVALYWFHPLAWIAARQAAAAREQACDEAVLALGTRPSAYARVLLELAESLQPAPAGLSALSMVQRAHLETRLMAILNDDVRAASGRGMTISAIAFAACTLILAALQPSVQASVGSIAIITPPARAGLPQLTAPPATTPVASPAQAVAGSGSPCITRFDDFVGTTSIRGDGGREMGSFSGRTTIRGAGAADASVEQIGTSGTDRIIQKNFGDLRVCMVAEGVDGSNSAERPSQWLGRARRVVLESRRGKDVKRLEIAPYSTGQKISWQVGGADRTFDAAAQQWRDRVLETLDTTWEISSLRGQVSSLRGEISSLRGEESSYRGEISSLQGEISTMRGRQSSLRGEESRLRGEISSIQGHLSSLRGAISSEQGNISSLTAGGYGVGDSSRTRDAIDHLQAEIARIEREIRDYNASAKVAAVERQIDALATDTKTAAIDADIKSFDVNGKIAAIEKTIAALDVDGKSAAIERQITALDSDRRVRQLEDRRDQELKRLDAAIAAIR